LITYLFSNKIEHQSYTEMNLKKLPSMYDQASKDMYSHS